MKVAIFCSAYASEEIFLAAAKEVSALLADAGFDLIFGGSNVSLMKSVADEFEIKKRKIYGYSIPVYREYCRPGIDSLFECGTTAQRKEQMIMDSNAVLVLPGGVGTLDELGDALELKKQKVFKGPIVILNTDGFYDGLKNQFMKMEQKGFLPKGVKAEDLVFFANTPKEASKKIMV